MSRQKSSYISHQAVGAYGEKVVEAELLREGWIPSNVNASIKNAADFDIFAWKASRGVRLRVKTCGPQMDAFQFGGFIPGKDIPYEDLGATDFMVLVRMGETRETDQFYVIPTRIVRETLGIYKKAYLAQKRRDGGARKDTGHWTLRLNELKTKEDRPNYGFERKWAKYRDKWPLLEGE
jgi:hypothetical protein